MASESDSQEKTEDPTPKRLEKAMEEGQVLSSKELMVFTTLFAGLFIYFVAVNSSGFLLGHWKGFFQFDLGEFNGELVRLSYEAFIYIMTFGLAIGVPMIIVVLFTQGTTAGRINFAPKALNFKGSRINPLQGFKRMVSIKALVEMLKGIAKVIFLIGVTYLVISAAISALLTSSDANLLKGLERVHSTFIALFIALLLVLATIALLDVLFQRHQHIQQLRMSRQDVKDEHKQTEGSPEVKAKIRRMQMTNAARAAQQRKALDDVPSATAVITNPTHFAVALKYDVGARGAPTILAMGRGKMAADIIEIAQTESVPIFQSPLLARALFFTGEIGAEIHEELFSAVAAVLAFIFRIANGENLEVPDIEVPEDLQFNETGERYNA